MTAVRLATRGSDLALAQARYVAARLEAELRVAVELVQITTTGDRLAGSLAKVGGKGLFVKEIEQALLEGAADLAIHSAKDLPSAQPDALELVAFPERADPRDALVGRERGVGVAGLPRGARVGTGSLRRGAQLEALRPDLEIVPLRGNVPTRIRKLETEGLDAVVLACAGLDRLGLSDRIDERIAPGDMLPAAAQGILALQGRRDDPVARDAAALDDARARTRATAERQVLVRLEADCTVPLAAHAELDGDGVALRGLLLDPDGAAPVRAAHAGVAATAAAVGDAVAEALLEAGGRELLARLAAEGATA